VTDSAEKTLARIYAAGGTWPDVIGNHSDGKELMRLGLLELIKPSAPYLPYATLTKAGMKRARIER